MRDIKEIRKDINKVDEEMRSLFIERMNLSKEVAEYKKENALTIYDEKREQEVISKNVNAIESDELRPYYLSYLTNVIDISKRYQGYVLNGMKVAYAGLEGSFAHIASLKLFPTQELVSLPSFVEAYKALENNEVDSVVLPIENSYAGDVGEVMDLIFSGSLYVNKVINLEVSHNLLGVKGSSKSSIKTVYSHPQALSQCKEYLNKQGYQTVEASNTAIAAKRIAELNDPTIGVIASIEAAELYGLEVIDKNINTSSSNTTRFGALSKTLTSVDKKAKDVHSLFMFTVKNEAGCLAQALNIIGLHSFNMRSLTSRPLKGLMWTYYFYVEIEGNLKDDEGQQMLKELESVCSNVKIGGIY